MFARIFRLVAVGRGVATCLRLVGCSYTSDPEQFSLQENRRKCSCFPAGGGKQRGKHEGSFLIRQELPNLDSFTLRKTEGGMREHFLTPFYQRENRSRSEVLDDSHVVTRPLFFHASSFWNPLPRRTPPTRSGWIGCIMIAGIQMRTVLVGSAMLGMLHRPSRSTTV